MEKSSSTRTGTLPRGLSARYESAFKSPLSSESSILLYCSALCSNANQTRQVKGDPDK